jgi:hypothetical protein
MKSFHISLFNSVSKSAKESRLVFGVGSLASSAGSAANSAAEKAKAAAKAAAEEAKKPSDVTPAAMNEKFSAIAVGWRDKAKEAGHTEGFADKMEELLGPVDAKLKLILKDGLTKGEVAKFGKDLKELEAKATQAVKVDKARKRIQETKKLITKQLVNDKIEEIAMADPGIINLSDELEDIVIKKLQDTYGEQIHKDIHKGLDSIDEQLKMGSSDEKIQSAIGMISSSPENSEEALADLSDYEAVTDVTTVIQEYVKSIQIVLDASGDCFKNAGIDMSDGSAAKGQFDLWMNKLRIWITDGSKSIEDFVAETKKVQTHIIAADIYEQLDPAKQKELLTALVAANIVPTGTEKLTVSIFIDVLLHTNIGYTSLGAENKKSKGLQTVAKLVSGIIGKNKNLKMRVEGGADSDKIGLNEKTIPTIIGLQQLAISYGKLKEENRNKIIESSPQLAASADFLAKFVALSSKASKEGEKSPLVAFLEENPDALGAGGPINSLLALQRVVSVTGPLNDDSIIFQKNCTALATAATGKSKASDRRSSIGLELNVKFDKNVKLPKAKVAKAGTEKATEGADQKIIAERKRMVGKELKDASASQIGTNHVKIGGITFKLPVDSSDQFWLSKKPYVLEGTYKGNKITCSIDPKSDNMSIDITFGNIARVVGYSLKDEIKALKKMPAVARVKVDAPKKKGTEKLSAKQNALIEKRTMAFVNARSLMGFKGSIDSGATISDHTKFKLASDMNNDFWLKGEGGVVLKGECMGKKIKCEISIKEGNLVTITDHKGIKLEGVKPEDFKNKIISLERKETIAMNKKAVKDVILKAGGVFYPGDQTCNIKGVTFSLSDYSDEVYALGHAKYALVAQDYNITCGIDIDPPHSYIVAAGTEDFSKGGKVDFGTAIQRAKAKLDAPRKGGEPVA